MEISFQINYLFKDTVRDENSFLFSQKLINIEKKINFLRNRSMIYFMDNDQIYNNTERNLCVSVCKRVCECFNGVLKRLHVHVELQN